MIEMVSITPEEALHEVRQPFSKLRNLILGGYSLSEDALDDPVGAAEFEYQAPEDRIRIFLAKEGEEVVGSLTLTLWKDSPQDKRGKKFWPELERLSPETVKTARSMGALACDVRGIVTDPEVRGKGIAYSLFTQAIRELQPVAIVGQTKTVAAVALRKKLAAQGFRTFYNETEVTPDHFQQTTRDHLAFLQAYLFAIDKEPDELFPEGYMYIYDGDISPTVPSVESFSEDIQAAFQPVIEVQQKEGDAHTIMAPILSIRNELLK